MRVPVSGSPELGTQKLETRLPAPPSASGQGTISQVDLRAARTRRLGSRPARRAGSRSGHEELLVWRGSTDCPSRLVTEDRLPPARGSNSICPQEAAAGEGPPPLLPLLGRRSSAGAPPAWDPRRPWVQSAGSHHGAKCNSSVFPQTAEPKTRRGRTGEKKHLET